MRQKSSKRRILAATGHLCFGQLHPSHHLQGAEQPSCRAILPVRSQDFLVYAEASWTKQCCQRGAEASPAALTKLKRGTAIRHAVQLQEMPFPRGAGRCSHWQKRSPARRPQLPRSDAPALPGLPSRQIVKQS